MNILRTVHDVTLNEGAEAASGLFNLSNNTDVSFWFDVETKDRLMKLEEAQFWHQSMDIIHDSIVS
jgi:hypothetical protein